MKIIVISVVIGLFAAVLLTVAGCSPEVGSDRWCEYMNEKPKGDWTANEAAEYTQNCILK